MDEGQVKSNALDEMNEVLAKREEIFTQREKQIENRMNELKNYELRVMEAAKKLQQDNEKFKKLVEEKNAEFIEKQKAIDIEWEKIHEYEEHCKRSMERVIEEQVKLQEKDNAQLEAAFKTEQEKIAGTSSALDELMASLDTSGIVPNFGTLETVDDTENRIEEKTDDIPELLKAFEKAAKKVFPKGNVQELIPERFCMIVGTRKIRVFVNGYSKSNLPYVCVLEQKKDSKKLQQDIVQKNRMQSEWEFDYKENHFTSCMPFTDKTSAEVVLTLCKKVMDEYF